MDRNQSPAPVAGMSFILISDKFIDSILLYVFKVIPDAHAIVFFVPIIHPFNGLAWVLVTLEAKTEITFFTVIYPVAFSKQISAFIVPGVASCALASVQLIDMGKIPAA